MKGKALGRGLSALIPGAGSGDEGDNLLYIKPEEIRLNPFQPREGMDAEALRELAESIKENGVIQPVAVCRKDDGYQLISGGRRLKAAQMAGLSTIPAFLIEVETDAQLLEMAIVENLQREDLHPLEIAQGFRRLMEECGLTQEMVAVKVGKSRPAVANFLRLLKLPGDIKQALREDKISMGHARALLAVEDEKEMSRWCRRAMKEGIPVNRLEKMIAAGKKANPLPHHLVEKNPYLSDIENRLRGIYATKVTVTGRKKGGVIEIAYFSEEELERILEMLEKANSE